MPKGSRGYLSLQPVRARVTLVNLNALHFWLLLQLKVSKCPGSGEAGAGLDVMLIKCTL